MNEENQESGNEEMIFFPINDRSTLTSFGVMLARMNNVPTAFTSFRLFFLVACHYRFFTDSHDDGAVRLRLRYLDTVPHHHRQHHNDCNGGS